MSHLHFGVHVGIAKPRLSNLKTIPAMLTEVLLTISFKTPKEKKKEGYAHLSDQAQMSRERN